MQTPAIHSLDFTRISPFDGEPLPDNMRAYRAKSGKIRIKPSIELARQLEEDCVGFCINCGDTDQFAEPDAAKYTCEACGEAAVYGGAELILMGLVF